MKIQFFGFEWRLGKKVTMDDFYKHLHSVNGKEYKDQYREHIFAITKEQGWLAGIFLTARDAKSFCQLRRESQTFTVTPNQLAENTQMVDFNFFVIFPSTGRGLYQHYYQSATLMRFNSFCGYRFDELRESKIKEAYESLVTPTEKAKRTVRQQFLDKLGYECLERPGTFGQRVKELEEVKQLECEFTTYKPLEKKFQPLVNKATKIVHRVSFEKDTTGFVRNTIAKYANDNIFRRAKVVGIDPQKQERTYKLLNDFEKFAEFEYDQMVNTVQIDSTDLVKSIKESHVIETLISIAQNPAVKPLLCTPSSS